MGLNKEVNMKCEHEWEGREHERHCTKCGIYPDLLKDIFYIKKQKPMTKRTVVLKMRDEGVSFPLTTKNCTMTQLRKYCRLMLKCNDLSPKERKTFGGVLARK